MELIRIYTLSNGHKRGVYHMPDYACRFNRADFPKEGYYTVRLDGNNDWVQGTISKQVFKTLRDVEAAFEKARAVLGGNYATA